MTITMKKMPNSTRKFIRTQKAQIRRQFFDVKKQQEQIALLYKKISETSKVEQAKEAKEQPKVKVKAEKNSPR